MQHRSPRAAAVGVDLGTSSTTVSIRGRGERSTTREFDGLSRERATDSLISAFDRVRAFRDDAEETAAQVSIVAPAAWERDRLSEVAAAAAAANLGRPTFVSTAEAAAVYAEAHGREFAPGAALVVYDLGSGSCEIGVVRLDEDGRTVLAAHTTDGIGGDEFDHLVLAYLSGRHGDDDPEFWGRVAAPSEETLRPALLEEIRRARERLSEQPSADIALPEAGLELELTQQELESCIGELVDQSCELAAEVLAVSGAEEPAGLLLTGGASRTPLVVARLSERLGLKPVLPERPERVLGEGAALAVRTEAPDEPAPSRLRRNVLRVGVLTALLAGLIGTTAIFGSELGSGVSYEVGGPESTSTAPSSESTSPAEDGDLGSGGPGHAPGDGESRSPEPDETGEPGDTAPPPEQDEAPPPTEDDREEEATAGYVPNLVAMSAEEAGETLSSTGFTNVEYKAEPDPVFGPWYDDCEVKEQSPEPGTTHAFDEPVTVVYSGSESDDCEP